MNALDEHFYLKYTSCFALNIYWSGNGWSFVFGSVNAGDEYFYLKYTSYFALTVYWSGDGSSFVCGSVNAGDEYFYLGTQPPFPCPQ